MKYRKKPVVVEAVRYKIGMKHPALCNRADAPGIANTHIHTTHKGQAVMLESGDWIISELDGIHYYPCKPDIFEATYEKVED
jgi:hypothetical protein